MVRTAVACLDWEKPAATLLLCCSLWKTSLQEDFRGSMGHPSQNRFANGVCHVPRRWRQYHCHSGVWRKLLPERGKESIGSEIPLAGMCVCV